MDMITNFAIQLCDLIIILIIVRAVSSWFIRDLSNPAVKFLYDITEPLLAPFRGLLQNLGLSKTLDLSPIALYITIQFVKGLLRGM